MDARTHLATKEVGPYSHTATDGVLPRVTYISWAESCSRSDHTARELGGSSHMVYAPAFGSRVSTVLLKYVVQWIRTARILRRERPDVVFVMTPPVVAALPALFYARRHGATLVVDAHTAAFLHPRWRRWRWLQRSVCARAATTLVHTQHIGSLVEAGGAHATLVPDVPVLFSETQPFERPANFVVAVVCSFNYDEPIDAIVEAARLTPDVSYFVTGNPKHLVPEIAQALPANLRLTGFLSTGGYGGLLACADAVMTLTTRDHTMLRGAYEAIYQGTPVIVSDWPLLKDAFDIGALHVNNTPAEIVAAVRKMQSSHVELRRAAEELRARKLARWHATRAAIIARLGRRPA